jgi:hypothetical protein
MSPRDIGTLAFKLAGIFAIIQAIRMLPPLLAVPAWDLSEALDQNFNVPLLITGQLVPIIILVSLGISLYAGSRALAKATVGEAVEGRAPLQLAQIHAVLFSVVGALLIGIAAQSVPELFRNLAVLLSDYGIDGYRERRLDLIKNNWQWAIGSGMQLAIGIGLLFWSKRAAAIFHKTAIPAGAERKAHACPNCDQPFFIEDYRPDVATRRCSKCDEELPDGLFAKDSQQDQHIS